MPTPGRLPSLGLMFLRVVILLVASTTNSESRTCRPTHFPNATPVNMPEVLSVEVGSEIRLNCSALPNTIKVNSSSLSIVPSTRSGVYPGNGLAFVEVVDDTTIAFMKKNASADDAGEYECVAEVYGRKLASCHTDVKVGVKPGKVENFTCTIIAYQNLTCTWNNPKNGGISSNYTIEMNKFGDWKPCPTNYREESACTWTGESEPSFNRFLKIFRFRVTGTNDLGNDSWTYNFTIRSILKLSPVTEVRYENLTSRGVTIQWHLPEEADRAHRAMFDKNRLLPTITHRVEFRRKGAPSIVELSESRWLPYSKLRYGKLRPHRKYEVAVSCRMQEADRDDLFSDPVSFSVTTLKDKPSMPPQIHQSSFEYKPVNGGRSVTLLFQEIPHDEWNDDAVEYVIQNCSELPSGRSCTNRTVANTMAELRDLNSSTAYDVTIWTKNSNGTSDTGSTMRILPQRELQSLPALDPTDMSVVLSGSSTAEISWEVPAWFENEWFEPIVYWCQQDPLQTCKDPIRWRVLEVNTSSTVLNVDSPASLSYGLAMSDSGSHLSSGVTWTKCISTDNNHIVELKVSQLLQGDTEATLELHWEKVCSYQRKYIDLYQIEYCQIVSDNTSRYTDNQEECQRYEESPFCQKKNVSTQHQSSLNKYKIEDLENGQAYRVIMRVHDRRTGSYGVNSQAACALVKDRWSAAKVFIVGFFTVGIMAFLILVIKRLCKWLRDLYTEARKIKIDLPISLGGYFDFQERMQAFRGRGQYLHDGNFGIAQAPTPVPLTPGGETSNGSDVRTRMVSNAEARLAHNQNSNGVSKSLSGVAVDASNSSGGYVSFQRAQLVHTPHDMVQPAATPLQFNMSSDPVAFQQADKINSETNSVETNLNQITGRHLLERISHESPSAADAIKAQCTSANVPYTGAITTHYAGPATLGVRASTSSSSRDYIPFEEVLETLSPPAGSNNSVPIINVKITDEDAGRVLVEEICHFIDAVVTDGGEDSGDDASPEIVSMTPLLDTPPNSRLVKCDRMVDGESSGYAVPLEDAVRTTDRSYPERRSYQSLSSEPATVAISDVELSASYEPVLEGGVLKSISSNALSNDDLSSASRRSVAAYAGETRKYPSDYQPFEKGIQLAQPQLTSAGSVAHLRANSLEDETTSCCSSLEGLHECNL